MPDDRILHRRAGHSQKVAELSDFEHRVWIDYLLYSDDFGIMRATAATVQAGDDAMANRPAGKIHRGLTSLIDVGLLRTFMHQNARFVYQHDWQDWQRVRFPRRTDNPAPPPDALAACAPSTRQLFADWFPGGKKRERENHQDSAEVLPQSSVNSSEVLPQDSPSRAGTRETANGLRLTANAPGPEGEPGEPAAGATLVGSEHRAHASCGRVCVPAFLHRRFRAQVGGAEGTADRTLRAFYRRVLAGIPESQAIGDDPVKFWQAYFAAEFPSAAPSKVSASAAAVDRWAERKRAELAQRARGDA